MIEKEQVRLSSLIKGWDIIHVKDTDELGFSELVKAIEKSGVEVINDIQPADKS